VLVVADPERITELVGALSEPLLTEIAGGRIDLLVSSGGDDTIELVEARKPHVIVVTATLTAGDATSLVDTIRGMMPRAEVAVVVIGDEEGGPIRNALDALELAPDRFVTRPMSAKALRFAVASGIEAVTLVRGPQPSARGTSPGVMSEERKPAVPPQAQEATQRAALRARWSALADSIVDVTDDIIEEDERVDEPEPLPPPIVIKPRRKTAPVLDAVQEPDIWKPGNTAELAPVAPAHKPWSEPVEAPTREPTLILSDHEAAPPESQAEITIDRGVVTAESRTSSRDRWSEPLPLAELVDRDTKPRAAEAQASTRNSGRIRKTDELGLPLDDFDDDDIVIDDSRHRPSDPRLEVLADLPSTTPVIDEPRQSLDNGRDFARQLRAKMSQMAQRLFQGADAAGAPNAADLAPRHDHHTEIDLASLGEDLPLGGGHTEIESRAHRAPVELTTSPGSWDTQVRERGLPDTGEIVRGVSDAAMLLAKMFAGGVTGRVLFRHDGAEKIVFFDQGRPVFASSSEPRDRMGGLLVREGKITASQYDRCQAIVAESGRRMGEILVDFGYLKRRELLPAVRRHVEDIVYSLFGWDRGHYQISTDAQPSGERIRLSRHPAAIVLEGIRRKFDRTSLERLVGPPSTVIEVRDRERLGGIINMGDLAAEERGALAAFDGQADLGTVARIGGVDVADVLPLAWGLCVLGLANARRTDTELPDESTALVGETDLAIDRERVRARWQLVTDADYFALLGVRRDATGFEIRRAYQAARRDFAADGFPSDLRRELAQELDDIANVLDEAFRVLRDDRLRVTYLTNLIE
jgi:DNA-binding NarL/FixJ family response regulator